MKKIMMLLIVAVFMLGVAGNAMASFGENDLIRVVYSTNNGQGTEYATDLGTAYGNLTDASQLTAPVTISTGAFTPTSVGQTDFSNMYVAYFIFDTAGVNGHAWTSGPQNAAATNPGAYFTFNGGAGTAAQLWQQGGATTHTNAQSNASSYWSQMNVNGQGSMAGFVNSSADKNLTALNAGGAGYVDQVLYYYGSDPTVGGKGTAVAILRTSAAGTTELMQVAQTPIPAAIYLFGSGLMGLVGLRRKMVA